MFDPTTIQNLSKQALKLTKELEEAVAEKCQKKGSRIYVCDDEEKSRLLVASMLQKYQYRVVVGADGEEFLETLKGNDIGLLITDLMMPNVSGMQLVDALDGSKVDVIVMTGLSDDHEDVVRLRERGIVVLHKPFKIHDLINEVRVHFGLPTDTRQGPTPDAA